VFDTVCHQILLSKLEHYGVRGSVLNLIASYVGQRTRCVCINANTSSPKNINYGVSQGSILGPLLFLIYVNDIHNIIDQSNNGPGIK